MGDLPGWARAAVRCVAAAGESARVRRHYTRGVQGRAARSRRRSRFAPQGSERMPAELFQIDPPPQIEVHPLGLEPFALFAGAVAVAAAAYFAAAIDDPMPRHASTFGQGSHGVTHLPGSALPGQPGDAPVGADPPPGNAHHRGVDALVAGVGALFSAEAFHRRVCSPGRFHWCSGTGNGRDQAAGRLPGKGRRAAHRAAGTASGA